MSTTEKYVFLWNTIYPFSKKCAKQLLSTGSMSGTKAIDPELTLTILENKAM